MQAATAQGGIAGGQGQCAGFKRGAAAVGVEAIEGGDARTAQHQTAGAADPVGGEGEVAVGAEHQAGVVDDAAGRGQGQSPAIGQLQGACAYRGGAGVALCCGHQQGAGAGFDQTTGAADDAGVTA